jgi:hypothetical protein
LVGAIALFFNWYASTVVSLTKRADSAGVARNKHLSVDNLRKSPGETKKGAKAPSPSQSAPTFTPIPALVTNRIVAPTTKQIGDMTVGVSATRIGPILLKNNRYIDGKYITFELRITNVSQNPINYQSWSQQTKGIVLCDQYKNYYNRVTITEPPIVEQTILPNTTITDIIAFEAPIRAYGYLDLDLPSARDTLYQFRILAFNTELVDVPKPQAPVQPDKPPFNPENDFQLRQRVKSDYLAAASGIVRKSKGMGIDRARKYREKAFEELMKELTERYNLTPSQVRNMVR